MKSHDISIWEVKQKTPARTDKKGRKKAATYQVRWSVGGKEKYRTLNNKTLAKAWWSKLVVAMQNGEPFDTVTGLPDSLVEKPDQVTWYVFAATYMDMKWKTLSAKARETTVYALSTVIASLVASSKPGRPDMQTLRRALQQWYLEPSKREATGDSDGDADDAVATPTESEDEGKRKPPADIRKALTWLEKNSLPVGAIAEAKHARAVLDALATKMDGTAAKPDYLKRRRGVAANVVRFAIECGELKEDPFQAIQWTPPKVAKQIDRRRVPNPDQVRQLLIGVSYVGTWKRAGGRRYVAFFGCLYYAMMRPEEVIGLRAADCQLPDKGWGLIILHKATPYAGSRWTDSGELHDDKALKARADGETRPVPIPPVLVPSFAHSW